MELVLSPDRPRTPARVAMPDHIVATISHVAAVEHVPTFYYQTQWEDRHLDEAISILEGLLLPTGTVRAAKGVEYCQRLLSAKPLQADVLAGYASILGELPIDLLWKALKAGCAAATYHKVPPPGAFLSKVEDEWSRRKATLMRLRRHRDRIQFATRMRSHRPASVEAAAGRLNRQRQPLPG